MRIFDHDGKDITEELNRIGKRMRALGHLHTTQRIFDRCCHPGRDISAFRGFVRSIHRPLDD